MPTFPGGRPVIQARVLPKYPVGVAGDAGISLRLRNGIICGALHYEGLVEDTKPNTALYVLAVLERETGEYRTVPLAAAGSGYGGTSTTELTIGTGELRSFITQENLAYSLGSRVRATSSETGAWMEGLVTSYSGFTLNLVPDLVQGEGTHHDWLLSLAGQPGLQGPGSGDVHGPDEATDGRLALFDGETGKLLREGVARVADLPVAASGVSDAAKVVRSDDARLSDQRVPPDGSVGTAKMQPASVTDAILAPRPTSTLRGRVSGGAGAPENLTGAQAASILPTFGQDTKGLAPGPTAAHLASTAILRADGWGPQLAPRQAISVVTGSGSLNAFHGGRHLVVSGASDLTLTLAAAASLGDGWWCSFEVTSNVVATIAGQAGEQVDGVAGGTRRVFQRQHGRIVCDGAGFRVVGVPDRVLLNSGSGITANGYGFTIPVGYAFFEIEYLISVSGSALNTLYLRTSLDGGTTYQNSFTQFDGGGASGGVTVGLYVSNAIANGVAYGQGRVNLWPGSAIKGPHTRTNSSNHPGNVGDRAQYIAARGDAAGRINRALLSTDGAQTLNFNETRLWGMI